MNSRSPCVGEQSPSYRIWLAHKPLSLANFNRLRESWDTSKRDAIMTKSRVRQYNADCGNALMYSLNGAR